MLSPLLFVLIIEGLSKLIGENKNDKKITGLKLSSMLCITHMIFVDAIHIFCCGLKSAWEHYKELFDLFYVALGMLGSIHKSHFISSRDDEFVWNHAHLWNYENY